MTEWLLQGLRGAMIAAAMLAVQLDAATDDWAVAVIEYAPVDPHPGYTNAAFALGHATTTTVWDTGYEDEPVRLFTPPLDVVSIGNGGHLTLQMGGPVINEEDPVHPYGVDLIVYGNSFFATTRNDAARYSAPWLEDFPAEPAEIWVSQDCSNWFRAANCVADSLMPAQSLSISNTPSDYLYPVDPALLTNDWFDGTWSYSNTLAAYAGAAGGVPVDLSKLVDAAGTATNLAWIRYVKLVDISGYSSEIDAVARVVTLPEPCGAILPVVVAVALSRRRQRAPRRQPRGTALAFTVVLCGAMASCACVFVLMVASAHQESEASLTSVTLQTCVASALDHARALLAGDLAEGPSDSYNDSWAVSPRGASFGSRAEWNRYAAAPDDITNQHWFTMPGAPLGRMVRYRLELIDVQPMPGATAGVQPIVAAAWHENRWMPTDDINTVDACRFTDLLSVFDARATNQAWRAQAVARFIDDRDENHALADADIPGTEAIQFDRVVTDVDTRWNHLDDTLRLGRYYEERPSHNFFLISDWRAELDAQTGRSNIVVTLDAEPAADIAGWAKYRALRSTAGLPRWHGTMWKDATAVTGAGSLLKRQPAMDSTTDTLTFDDDDPRRYQPSGSIRQTVTLDNWFSSLNTYIRSDVRACRTRGALLTTRPYALDSILLTNLAASTPYCIELFTGHRMDGDVTAFAGTGDFASLGPVAFSRDGSGLIAGGSTTARMPLELFVRAPRQGVSLQSPFYLESAVLRQPQYVTLRNASDAPVNLRGWRLGYQFGERVLWTAPFATSRLWTAQGPFVASVPSIPAHGTLTLTPDIALFDAFFGATPGGEWGDAPAEHMPVVATPAETWFPAFAVSSTRPLREYSAPSTSGSSFPWETDWQIESDQLDGDNAECNLAGEVVLFDADGPGTEQPPVPGLVVKHTGSSVAIRFAGSRTRFAPKPEATLRMYGVPRTVRSFWLVTPEGSIAARITLPLPNGDDHKIPWDFSCSSDGSVVRTPRDWAVLRSALESSPARAIKTIRNSPCPSPDEKYTALADAGVSSKPDWFLSDSLRCPFSDTGCVRETTLRLSRDVATVVGAEKGYYSLQGVSLDFPAGMPSLLCTEARLNSGARFAVKSFRDGGIETFPSRDSTATQAFARTIVIGPSAYTSGIHIFGEQGFLIAEWRGIPMPDHPIHATLAGRSAQAFNPPSSMTAWHTATNDPIILSISVWIPAARAFAPLVSRRAFDLSDRIDLGDLRTSCFSNHTLRLKIETHQTLAPKTAALWLDGVYLHPISTRRTVNINTIAPRSLPGFCGNDGRTATALLTAHAYPFDSFSSLTGTLRDQLPGTHVDVSPFSVRSDLFDLRFEAEVFACAADMTNLLARTTRTLTLDRSDTRLDPAHPVLIAVDRPMAAALLRAGHSRTNAPTTRSGSLL